MWSFLSALKEVFSIVRDIGVAFVGFFKKNPNDSDEKQYSINLKNKKDRNKMIILAVITLVIIAVIILLIMF